MAFIDGDDPINGSLFSFEEWQRMKNNWRAAAAPANIQPGMIFSKSPNDKLYHAGVASAQEEILQLSRSADVSPTFLYETLLGRNLKTWWNFEDFLSAYDTAYSIGIWSGNISGAAAYIRDAQATALRPGIVHFSTGSTTTGTAVIYIGRNVYSAFLFGGGIYTIETDLQLVNLSTVTETFTVRFGFGDSSVGGDETDGAYFEYSDVGATPNWYRCTASNSVRTKIDTGVAAVAGAWIRLKVVVNADGTSVEYFINGVSVGSNTTNIPTTAGRETSAVLSIIKSAGTADRLVYIDWAWIHIDLATSR